jgi:hypothetical protein
VNFREAEAKSLAATIRAYWFAKGWSPLVWVERELCSSSAADQRFIYGVRSDMIGGWPRPMATPSSPTLKIVSGVTPDSDSRIAALCRIGQQKMAKEPVRASKGFCGEVRRAG